MDDDDEEAGCVVGEGGCERALELLVLSCRSAPDLREGLARSLLSLSLFVRRELSGERACPWTLRDGGE